MMMSDDDHSTRSSSAVGKLSLDDCDLLTWSLGWTGSFPAEREIRQAALRLCPPIAIGSHFDLAQAVGFNPAALRHVVPLPRGLTTTLLGG